jgi:hypothetical protein
VVSEQDAFDWRSSLRVGLRFAASRGRVTGLRIALVARHFNESARDDVLAVANDAQIDCRVFRREGEAIAWLSSGSATHEPEEPRQ